MPWYEKPLCWVPSRGETEDQGRRVQVMYEVDDARVAARGAALKYVEIAAAAGKPPVSLDVRIKTDRGTFDVRVDVELVPKLRAGVPTPVPSTELSGSSDAGGLPEDGGADGGEGGVPAAPLPPAVDEK